MKQTLRIAPITRIEGHAALDIFLDDDGNVEDTQLSVMSLRGFERFSQGRPAEELPHLVTRICGICPWQHHLASVKAVEAAFGVTPPPTATLLRELCQMMATIPDKLLHFYFLAAPDLILGPDADPKTRNVLGLVATIPELAKKAVAARMSMVRLLEKFTGKAIHPVSAVVGGFTKPLLEEERKEFLEVIGGVKEFCAITLSHAREKILPASIEMLRGISDYPSSYLGTVRPSDGAFSLYEGDLRLMDPSGTYRQFAPHNYLEHIEEESRSWSWLTFPHLKQHGPLDLKYTGEPEGPAGIYRVNTLARVNVAEHMGTPLAQKELEIFRQQWGRPAHSIGLYHWTRLIELVYCCERAEELLLNPAILSREVRLSTVAPCAGEGVGHLEAPRGTLFYHVRTDEQGLLTHINIIPGTTHNNAGMHISMQLAAKNLIKKGQVNEGLLNRVEMCLRAYDP